MIEIGWVQTLAVASCFVALVAGATSLTHAWLRQKHAREKMRMEQDYEMISGLDDD